MKKLFFPILFALVFIVGLTGCSSKIGYSELVSKYCDNIKSNNSGANYDLLSSASKNIWLNEKFKEWESIQEEVFPANDVKVEKTNEYEDKELEGITYPEVVEYNITKSYYDKYNDKDANSTFIIYAVKENNQWKIYRGEEEPNEKISQAKCNLASMYFTGKGKNKDVDKAQDIMKESIKENPDYSNSYYLLAYMYTYLQKYDDAITMIQENIDKAKSNDEKSNQYDVLGLAYEGKQDYIKAKDYYTQSINANPNNEAAKSNLEKLNLQLSNK